MENGVGGAAHCHVEHKRVLEGFRRDEIFGARRVVHFCEFDDAERRFAPEVDAGGIVGGDGSVAGKRDSERFAETVHAVCREHAGAGAGTGAGGAFESFELSIVNFVDDACGDAFKDGVEVGVVGCARGFAGAHRAAGSEDGWNVQTHGAHEHSGNDFVAVRNADHGVEGMCGTHGFHAVRDDFTAGEGVFHSGVSHGDAVADCDGVEFVGNAAGFADGVADDFTDLFEVAVSGDDVGVGVADSDKGF